MPENVINLYETRRMLATLEQIPPAPTFLRRFQKGVNQFDTDKIDIDIVKGGTKVAPYTSPVKEGVVIERDGYTTHTETIPYIRIKRTSEADKFMNRLSGETVYGAGTPAQRAAKQFTDDFADLGKMLDVEEERQRAEALFLGKVTIRNEKAVALKVINFGLTQTGAPTKLFSDPSTSFNDVLEFLRMKIKDITKTGAPAPTDIVVPDDVGNILIRVFNPDAKTSYLSSIRVDRGQLDIRTVEPGVLYLGYFKELGCDVWIYNGEYTDLDGALKPFVPSGKLGMFSQNARLEMNYGAIKNFHGNFAAISRFPHSWIEDDGRGRYIQLESAPLFVPFQIDSVGVYDVL
jgi:hypothetical protein